MYAISIESFSFLFLKKEKKEIKFKNKSWTISISSRNVLLLTFYGEEILLLFFLLFRASISKRGHGRFSETRESKARAESREEEIRLDYF